MIEKGQEADMARQNTSAMMQASQRASQQAQAAQDRRSQEAFRAMQPPRPGGRV